MPQRPTLASTSEEWKCIGEARRKRLFREPVLSLWLDTELCISLALNTPDIPGATASPILCPLCVVLRSLPRPCLYLLCLLGGSTFHTPPHLSYLTLQMPRSTVLTHTGCNCLPRPEPPLDQQGGARQGLICHGCIPSLCSGSGT